MTEDLSQALHQAMILHRSGQLTRAIATYRDMLKTAPDHPDLWHLLGTALIGAHQSEEGVAAIRHALQFQPHSGLYWGNLALGLLDLGQKNAAEEAFRTALIHAPTHAGAHRNLGILLMCRAQMQDAVFHLKRVTELRPEDPKGWYDLGKANMLRGDGEKAVAQLARAAGLGMSGPELSLKQAFAIEKRDGCIAGLSAYRHAVASYPDDGAIQDYALYAFAQDWDWQAMAPVLARARQQYFTSKHRFRPFWTLALEPDCALATKVAQRESDHIMRNITPLAPVPVPAAPGPRLRIGYLCGDFHEHPTLQLMGGIFRHHDTARFDIHCYATHQNENSPLRQRLKKQVAHFTPLQGRADHEIATLIRNDGIDVLVEINGHTTRHNLAAVSYRPAPVQIHYLAYPGSIGCAGLDYFIGDWVTIPAQGRCEFAEKVIRLPNSYQCYDPGQPFEIGVRDRKTWGLPEDKVVYCSFNASYKINPDVLTAWAEILTAVPDSVLWLLSPSAAASQRFIGFMTDRGIGKERLFPASREPWKQHFRRLPNADIALDCWPYGGHTTTSDALWCGVPLVSFSGDRFAARVGASILTDLDLHELIASDRRAYLECAIALGRDAVLRAQIRRKVRAARSGVFFDPVRKTRQLEAAYQAAYDQFLRGVKPTDIDLTEARWRALWQR